MKCYSRVVVFLISVLHCKCYVFPDNFKFGVATAAYQYEGAWNVSDKGESIWDRFTHSRPESIADGSTGDVACDGYNNLEEDIELIKDLGVHFYRFSISWTRILPNGTQDYINPDGIRYYNALIDELLANDITPMVTMYHWDLPQVFQDKGGFLNDSLIEYFEKYAEILYKNFGDRVKEWITFNEPLLICDFGYSTGLYSPGVNKTGIGGYICGHNLLRAHAKAYHLYNNQYKKIQKGRVGITLNNFWFEPFTNSTDDVAAAEVALQVNLGWFAHPIFSQSGDYPQVMKDRIAQFSKEERLPKSRLPEFTQEEIQLLRGSSDFFGFNHYTTYLVTTLPSEIITQRPSMQYDAGALYQIDNKWERTASSWLHVVPWGFRKMLVWIKDQYNNPEVIITENGCSDSGNILNDCKRVNYYNTYLAALLQAIHEDGCNITGYTAWSLMDIFEWISGYTEKFGLFSVDFDHPNRTRTGKMSAEVYRNIISTREIDWNYIPEGFTKCD